MEIGGPKLKRAQAKVRPFYFTCLRYVFGKESLLSYQVDASNDTIETLSSALSSAEVSEGNARKQATKANAAKVKSEKELAKVIFLFAVSL